MGEIYRGVSGVARRVVKQYRGVSNVAREVVEQYRGVNAVARQVFESKRYLIKDGEYSEPFTVTTVWDRYPLSAYDDNTVADGAEFALTKGDGYIQLYNKSWYFGALITEDAIDLSKYTKLHYEFDVKIYNIDDSTEYINGVHFGAHKSIPDGLLTGRPAVDTDGMIFDKGVYYKHRDSDFVTKSGTIDITDYTELGHIFAYVTSWNWQGDYSYLRIKKIWLS